MVDSELERFKKRVKEKQKERKILSRAKAGIMKEKAERKKKSIEKLKKVLSKQIRGGTKSIPKPTSIRIQLKPQQPQPVFVKSSLFKESTEARSNRMTQKGGILSKFRL